MNNKKDKLEENGQTPAQLSSPLPSTKASSFENPLIPQTKPQMPKPLSFGGCPQCTKPWLLCLCPKGGGGGGGGSEDKPKDDDSSTTPIDLGTHKVFVRDDEMTDGFLFALNRQSHNLSIQLRPDVLVDLEKAERYFSVLKQHFTFFKQQLAEKGECVDGFRQEISIGAIQFHIPAPFYIAFIQSLIDHHLAPKSLLAEIKQQTSTATNMSVVEYSLFSVKAQVPTLGHEKSEENQEHKYKTPFEINTKLILPS